MYTNLVQGHCKISYFLGEIKPIAWRPYNTCLNVVQEEKKGSVAL